jgi:hypothetical protein
VVYRTKISSRFIDTPGKNVYYTKLVGNNPGAGRDEAIGT